MTCIAGVAHAGRVWIGGDSCGSTPTAWQDVGNVKVFTLGEMLIGVCGSFRTIDLLRYQVPCVRQNDEPIDRFIRSTFAGSISDVLERFKVPDDVRAATNLLVGIAGRLFEVQSDLSVVDAPDWGFAVGEGADAARGSLHTTQGARGKTGIPEYRILAALRAAEAVCPSVRGPFGVLAMPPPRPRK